MLRLISLSLVCAIAYTASGSEKDDQFAATQINNCYSEDMETARKSCEAYIAAGGKSLGVYLRLGKLYKQKGDFVRAKEIFEQALTISNSSRIASEVKSSTSLVAEEDWIQKNGSSDKKAIANRADRIKCIRFSRIKPEIAQQPCQRYLAAISGQSRDSQVSEAYELVKKSLAPAAVSKESTTPPAATENIDVAIRKPAEKTTTRQQDESADTNTVQTPTASIADIEYSRETVARVQNLLDQLGYQPGPSDGNFGPQTENAIRTFESENGQRITGIPSTQLLIQLRQHVKNQPVVVAKQTTPPVENTVVITAPSTATSRAEIEALKEQIAELSRLIKTSTPIVSNTYQERGKRKALVVGNWLYPPSLGSLRNPGNDAKNIAEALRILHFEVSTIFNGDLKNMELGIRDFYQSIKPEDTALFYYAGHGVQIKGSNFLIPVGSGIEDPIDIKYRSVELSYVMEKIKRNNTGVTIIILDSCRDNPFANDRGLSAVQKGWAASRGPVGTLIAYATAPGNVASDGAGDNGLYTKHLVRLMKEPGLKIEELFKKVRREVERESNGEQIPWENSSLTGDFLFVNPNLSRI